MPGRFIYLDNNATTPLDERVLEEMLPYFRYAYANAGSTHLFGLTVREAVEHAGEQLADLIGATSDQIIFTSGATEAINLAIKGLSCPGRNHIVTLATEHKAVLDTCTYMEQQGYQLSILPVHKNGLMDMELLADTINDKTLLVCVMLANNETGVLQQVQQAAELAHAHDALLLSDATQAVGKMTVDVGELGVDLLALSAHKFYGPKGVGALYYSPLVKKHLATQLHGGGQQRGLRSGTLNVPGIIGMGKAASIAQTEMNEDAHRIRELRDKLEKDLLSIPRVFRNGDAEQRLYTTANLCFPGVNAEQMIIALQHISVSSGSACNAVTTRPSHVLKAMGLSDPDALSSLRFSPGRFTNLLEIEETVEKVSLALTRLRL